MNKINDELALLKKEIHRNLLIVKTSTGKYLETLEKGIDDGCIDIKDNIINASYWNDIGNFFLNTGSFSDAEKVYNNMLFNIEKSERENNETLHKGLAFYQYGVSKLVQKNYDEGVPYILSAIKEDVNRVGHKKSKSLFAAKFKSIILSNLENIIDKDYLPTINRYLTGFPPSSNILLNKLDDSEKMFLYKLIIAPQYIEFSNDIYTKNLLFNRIRELCLLFEVVLRKYPGSEGLTMGGLISNAYRTKSWYNAYNSKRKSFNNISEFRSLLDSLIKITFTNDEEFLSTIITQSYLIRNYISHYYDHYPELLSNKSIFETCNDRIIYAILYSLL